MGALLVLLLSAWPACAVARPVQEWTATTPAGSGRIEIDPGCVYFSGTSFSYASAALAISGDGTAYMTGCGEKGGGRTATTFAVRADGTVAWYRREPTDGAQAPAQAAAADPAGGAWIVGNTISGGQGSVGVRVRAYSATGVARWASGLSSSGGTFAALATASDGSYYVAHAQSPVSGNVVLRRLDAQGATIWQQVVALVPTNWVQVRFLAIAPSGDVLVAGNLQPGTTGSGSRGFVVSFSSTGAWRWSRLLSGPSGGAVMVQDFDVVADGGAHVALAQRSGTTARLQVVRLDGNGLIARTHDVIEVFDDDYAFVPLRADFALAAGPDNGAYVVASGLRAADGSWFRLIERLDSSGMRSWRIEEVPTSFPSFRNVAVDADGRAVVVGSGGTATQDTVPQIMVVDVQGNVVWSRLGEPSVPAPFARWIRLQSYFAVAIAPDGRIVAAGLQFAGEQFRPVLESWSSTGEALWQANAPPEDTMPGRLVDNTNLPDSMFAQAPGGDAYVLTRTRLGDGPAVTLTRFEQSGARAWTRTIGEAPDEFESPVGVSLIEGEPVLASVRYHGNSTSLTLRRYRDDGSLRWRRDPDLAFSFDPGLLRQIATDDGVALLLVDTFNPSGPRVFVLRFDANGNMVASGMSTEAGSSLTNPVIAARGNRVVALYGGRDAASSDICVAFEVDAAGALSWTWRDDAVGMSRWCARIAIAPDGATWITGALDAKPRAVRLSPSGTPSWSLVDVDASATDTWRQIAFVDAGDAIVSNDAAPSALTRISASGALTWRREQGGCAQASSLALDVLGRIVSACSSASGGRGLLRRHDAAGGILDTTAIIDLAPEALRIDSTGAIGIVGLQSPGTEAQRVAVARYAIDADLVFADGHE